MGGIQLYTNEWKHNFINREIIFRNKAELSTLREIATNT